MCNHEWTLIDTNNSYPCESVFICGRKWGIPAFLGKEEPSADDNGLKVMKNEMTVEEEVLGMLENTPETGGDLENLKRIETIDWDRDPEFVAGVLYGQVTEGILAAMDAEGINKTQLAERLGKSRRYVSSIFNESAKMDVKTLANLAIALNRKIEIRISR